MSAEGASAVTQHERLVARVKGRVQGVGFRHATQQEARRLGLSGWVRNRLDGDVELVAQGPREALEALVAFLRHGPPMARVRSVEVHFEPSQDDQSGFHVRQ